MEESRYPVLSKIDGQISDFEFKGYFTETESVKSREMKDISRKKVR
jgi:hypothetical protein